MKIFAHRGIGVGYPENTINALQESICKGFSVETDIRLSEDNDFILIHDANLKRLCGKNIDVASVKLSELEKISYLSSKKEVNTYKLSSFLSFCDFLKGSQDSNSVALHFKKEIQNKIGLELLVDYFQKYNLYEKVFVFDLTVESAQKLRLMDKNIKTAFIVSEFKFEETIYLWDEVKDLDFDIVWAAEWRSFYTQDLVRQIGRTGKKIFAMSPDVHKALGHPLAFDGYQKTWLNLIKYGIDGICTDKPLELQRFTQ